MNTATLERPSQLEYATITVAYVNPPKPGQKSASIKDTDGLYYWIKPAEMQDYVPSKSYKVGFSVTRSNDFTNRTIKSAEPVQQQRAQAARSAPQPQQRSAPVQHDAHQAAPQNGNGYYRPTSPADKQSMFICSQMNALISSRQIAPFNEETIATHIVMLARGYRIAMKELEQDPE
jgi:hypothetical protein